MENYLTLKNVSRSAVIFNLMAILLGILYLATITVYSILWDLSGIIFIITLFINLLLVYLISINVNKTDVLGNRMNLLCYIYPVFTILAMFGILIGNLLISVTYSNAPADLALFYFMIYGNYFTLLGLGFLLAFLTMKNLTSQDLWSNEKDLGRKSIAKNIKIKKYTKLILKILCYITLAFGLYFIYVMFFGAFDYISGVFGIFFHQFAAAIAFMFLSSTILLLKVKDKNKNPRGYYAVGLIGIIVTGVLMLPISISNATMWAAEANFTDAFGADWRDKIPNDVEEKYFMKTPFSSGGYWLGIPPKDVNYEDHVKFYEGDNINGNDDIKLYYDVYWVDDAEDLPGKASLFIRIHGGGWVFGDKGWGDMMQTGKYFAAQGYIVYDIQYALYDMDGMLDWDPLTPSYRKGNFDMEDILISLGIFTNYVTEHNEYDANLDSVFITGGSAGGHLTCLLGLGLASGNYKNILGDNLTVKGIIPYYPGNGIADMLGIKGDKELIDPTELVDKNSPPCLIYQGTSDGLVKFWDTQTLKDKYTEEDNDECAIIWLPLSGHSNDIYYPGYCQQIFLYYMERFCYLCVQGDIE
ncbi:MAG: hypothetical protein ACTSR8_06610 [Promethearchaeota archaeon]